MRHTFLTAFIWICILGSTFSVADPIPYNETGFYGRIALSHDGNFNDEDDWGAFPVAIAILDAFGVKDRIVHIDYNNILQHNDARFEKEMTASVLGAIERYGVPAAVVHNCRTDLDAAVKSLKDAVNASSRDNPLYYLVAGPMDVPYLGIAAADPAKRQFVYCVSHSSWNDGYGRPAKLPGGGRIESRTKRDLIDLGIKWIQVKHGGGLAYTGRPGTRSTPQEWALFHWMRDSSDPRLQWIFTRLEAEERADMSDATIAYSLMSGDEDCNPEKLAALLDKKQKPVRVAVRPTIRLEAENFVTLENCELAVVGRPASQNVTVRLSKAPKGSIKTDWHEMHVAPSARYTVDVLYRGPAVLTLRINGRDKTTVHSGTETWEIVGFENVSISQGDTIEIEFAAGEGQRPEIDYVELNNVEVFAAAPSTPAQPRKDSLGGVRKPKTDLAQPEPVGPGDPAAMPGQIIVDPADPRWLKRNGGERLFLFGAGNPEDFFFLGKRQADGTRTGGGQDKVIKRMAGTGSNTFHVLAMRDSRYNIEPGNGAPDCNPFVESDISGKLDDDILNQWEGWLSALEAADIYVLFNFYNDFDDYEEKAGWKLDANGNLHPRERYFIETLVNKYKHHKNIIWALEESCNKLSRARQQRLKKVAELVARTDEFHHPIAAMFQILYYDEVHPDKVNPEDYVDPPYVKVMTWGHYATEKKTLIPVDLYYRQLVEHWREAAGRYVLINTEVDKHPQKGPEARLYLWTSAMANVQNVNAFLRPDKAYIPAETFIDAGRVRQFMEQTDHHRMSPKSELKFGGTLYVLADEPRSYIAYSNQAAEPMGLRNLPAGAYRLLWFDTTDGRTVEQTVAITAGDHAWPKPSEMSGEVALYVKRLEGVR